MFWQLFFVHNAFACDLGNVSSSSIKIIFVNGIDNTLDDACSSAQKLKSVIGSNKYNYSYFYNVKDPNFDDQLELSWQAEQSNLALSENGYVASEIAGDANKKINYYKSLAVRYKNAITAPGTTLSVVNRLVTRIKTELQTTTNKSLILVAHSQGNFYVEAAYAILLNEAIANQDASIADLLLRLRVVGVASVAASTPHNRYLSHSNDFAVFVGQNAIASFTSSLTNYKPLKYNAIACAFSPCNDPDGKNVATLRYLAVLPEGGNNTALHNFQAVYLNDSFYSESTGKSFPSIISGLVQESINELGGGNSSYSININPIAFQQINNNGVSYSTGLVFWIPRSSSGAYDTATVQGLGTESQSGGLARLSDTGSGTSLAVQQSGGSYTGDVFSLPNSLAVNAIPAGTTYTVKLYKGTALVTTQTISLAGAVIAPSAMSASMFPALALNTYEALCPNGVATSSNWYSIPSSLPNSPQNNLTCSGSTASGRVESGDANNRRFDTEFSIGSASSLSVVASQEYNSVSRAWVATNVSTSAFISGYQNDNMSDIYIDTGGFNLDGKAIRFDITSPLCKMDLKVNTGDGAFVFFGNGIKMFPASWTPSGLAAGSYSLAFQTASASSMNWSFSKDGGQVASGVVATAGNVIRGTINPSSGGTYQQTIEVYMYDKNFIGGSSGCGIRNFAIQ